MRRRLFNVATALSLVPLIAVGILCIRAQIGSNDYLEWRSKNVDVPARPKDIANWKNDQWVAWQAEFEKWDRNRWGVHIRANPNEIFIFGRQPFFGYPKNSFSLHFYYWIVLPVFAILPAMVAVKRLRLMMTPKVGLCPCCGYDLRATPDRCPECGNETTAKNVIV